MIRALILTFTNTEDKRRLISNFFSLSVLQVANYILPLITLPYLVRVLGPEKFGLIAFAQAFITYFNILTDYGFNLSATREISINREDKNKISEIFSSVMIIKFGLLLFSFILMSAIVFSFKKFRQDWLIYYLTFGIVVGQVLFPVWFFQGMEKMKYITILNIVAKIIFTIAIFVFVKSVSDYVYVPLLNSIGFIIAGSLAFLIVFKDFHIKFIFPSINEIKNQLNEGWHIFLSIASIPLFNDTNIIILGIFTNNYAVAMYTLSARIIGTLIATQVPIVNTMFPFVSKEFKNKNYIFILDKLKRIRNIGVLFYFIVLSLIGLSSRWIVPIIFGEQFNNSISLVLIMLYVPLVCYLANIYGNQILINIGRSDLFSKVLIYAGIINLIIIIPLSIFLKENGAAISRLIIEIFIAILMYIFAKKELERIGVVR